MKKLIVLMIAITFCIVGSGVAWADEPATSALDRHAVWTKWIDEDNKPEKPIVMDTPREKGSVSTQHSVKADTSGGKADFDFVRETKRYDYSMDRGGAA